MTTVLTHLQALCALPGVSGREEAVRAYILDQLGRSRAGLEVTTDPLGNVLVKLAGRKRAARRHCRSIRRRKANGAEATHFFL